MKELRNTIKMSIRLSIDWMISSIVASTFLFFLLKILGFDADDLLKYALIFLGFNLLIVISASIGACFSQLATKSPGEIISNFFIRDKK